jgi:hypothetical protein
VWEPRIRGPPIRKHNIWDEQGIDEMRNEPTG